MRNLTLVCALLLAPLIPTDALAKDLDQASITKLEKLLRQKKTRQASKLLEGTQWCADPGIEHLKDDRRRGQFRANLGVFARRTKRLERALECVEYALLRDGSSAQAAALYEASLVMRKLKPARVREILSAAAEERFGSGKTHDASKGEANTLWQLMYCSPMEPNKKQLRALDSAPASVFLSALAHGHGSGTGALNVARGQSGLQHYLCTLRLTGLVEKTRKRARDPRAKLSRRLLMAAAFLAPRDTYLKKLDPIDRRAILDATAFPHMARWETVPKGDLTSWLYRRTYEPLAKTLKLKALPPTFAKLQKVWRRKRTNSESLEWKRRRRAKKSLGPGQRAELFVSCGGFGAGTSTPLIRNVFVLTQADKVRAFELGETHACLERHADASASIQGTDRTGRVRLSAKSSSWTAQGDRIFETFHEGLCDLTTPEPLCLRYSYPGVSIDATDTLYAITPERTRLRARSMPPLRLQEGKLVLKPTPGAFTFSEYASLQGLTLAQAKEQLPKIEAAIRARLLGEATAPK